ncbi:ABC transporter substrate-binding protein [Chachezhania sediminis]|uniref:ABC transporter substrate-binding protein n=1 Tax=Chachezhania sediminis TaxID=2599291 RepID=UPI00131DD233|nr:ABC transporter substrate-binding protein [Chachezhania sediminis]
MTIHSGRCATCAALVLSAGLAMAGAAQADTVLNVRMNADIRALDGFNRDSNSDTVTHHIFETLVAFTADLGIGPALAKDWTISGDGTVYTFHIRDGATFHDGSPVTSADVLWNWKWRTDPANEWVCASEFNGAKGLEVVSVEAPDDATVVFTLNAPNALFLMQLANIQCNAWIASPANVGEDGKWIAGSAIGSGSFMLEDWAKGQYVQLTAYDGYVPSGAPLSGLSGDRTAGVDHVRFQVIPDTAAAEAALYAGEIDILPGFEAARIDQATGRGIVVDSAPGLSWTPLLVQTLDPMMSNLTFRQALAHAIDWDQIVEVRTNGLASHNSSAVAEASVFFDEDFLEWPEYDPAKTAALLKDAGYNGEAVKIQTNTRYQGMYDNAVLVQAMLMAAGINAELETLDWAAQLDNYLAGKFQMQSFGYSARLDPSQMYGRLIGDKEASPSRQWQSDEAMALYVKSTQTADVEERRAIFKQLHKLMVQDLPIFGLYYEPVIDALGPKVENYTVWAADKTLLFGVGKAD